MNGKYDTLRFYITLIHSVLKKDAAAAAKNYTDKKAAILCYM